MPAVVVRCWLLTEVPVQSDKLGQLLARERPVPMQEDGTGLLPGSGLHFTVRRTQWQV